VTAAALLDDIRRCGATATLTQDGRLRIDPASVIDAALLASLKAQRDDSSSSLRDVIRPL